MILAWVAAAFLAGVALGEAPALSDLSLAALLALAGVAAATAWLIRRTRAAIPVLALAGLALGLARAPHPATHPGPGSLAFYVGRPIQLQGVVAAEPDVRDTGSNYVVDVQRISAGKLSRRVIGSLYIHTSRAVQLDYGHAVTVSGRLRRPFSALVPQGIEGQMRFPRMIDQGLQASGPSLLIVRIRQSLENGINQWLPEPEAALLIAITLGARSASLGDLAHQFVATGLIHIIAISGVKVAIVAGTLFALALKTGRRTLTLALSLSSLWCYVILTGLTPSGVRSAIMWTLLFIAWYLGRGTVSWISLLLAASVMVALEPSLMWNPGFQMSAVGTAGIIAFTHRISVWVRLLPSPVKESLSVTIAAQVSTLPIVADGFHVLAYTGPVTNAFGLPLLPILIVLGFAVGALAAVHVIAAPLAALSWELLHFVVIRVEQVAALPALPVPSLPLPLVVVYFALLVVLAAYELKSVNWTPIGSWPTRGRELAIGSIATLSILTWSVATASSDSTSHLYVLGTGNSLLLRSGGITALIDGSAKPFVLLERLGRLLPYSTRSIDLLVVTDPRASNVVGLEAVLQHYRVGEVLDVGAEYPSTTYARWRADLRARHIPTFALRTRAIVRLGSVSLTALGPDALYPKPQDCAALLRIDAPGQSVLVAGSASAREQREAVFRPVSLHASTLMIDGKGGFDQSFLQAVSPRSIISAHQPPGHWHSTSYSRANAPVRIF